MTYRRDSDVSAPYGLFTQSSQPSSSVKTIQDRVRDLPKPKLVAWVVSNCKTPSKREDYVDELQKHIPVDIFGKCGTKNCPGKRTNSECGILLEGDYMFYLAFENSKCQDYVSEKFFATLEMDIVPIVMGGADYSAIAPPGSYIDANHYSSAQELAEELKRLSNAREEYLKFFSWKAKTEVLDGYGQMGCNLCKALHESRPTKTYQDLGAWWRGGGIQDKKCIT